MSDNRRRVSTLALGAASPAFAASGPFFSLGNTDFVVLLGFIVFIAVLFYFKVPSLLGGMLDKRADGIIDSPVVAVKRRGRMEPDWSIPLSGGEITRW